MFLKKKKKKKKRRRRARIFPSLLSVILYGFSFFQFQAPEQEVELQVITATVCSGRLHSFKLIQLYILKIGGKTASIRTNPWCPGRAQTLRTLSLSLLTNLWCKDSFEESSSNWVAPRLQGKLRQGPATMQLFSLECTCVVVSRSTLCNLLSLL